jgi:hypothetical protein
MDPISAGVSAGGGLLGTILGQIFSAGDRYQAQEAMRRAADAYNIPLPVLQQMVAEQLPKSAEASVYADPNLAGAQTDSLGALKNISDSGGMTLEDKVNFGQSQREAAQGAMAQRKSIQNVLARSGAPSGVSAALQLGAARPAQEASALAGEKMSADAQRRAMQAVLQRGQMAGQQRQQGFNEASQRARATDLINQYNANARTQAQRYNLGLPGQQYQNELNRAAGVAGTQRAASDYYTGNANRVAGMASDLGAGAGLAAGAAIPKAAPTTTYGDTTNYGFSTAPTKLDEEELG